MEFNLASLVGVGGPVGIIALIGGFLLKAYLTKRDQDRADDKGERESESGIVETTKTALGIVREQMAQFGIDMERMRLDIAAKEKKITDQGQEISSLKDRVAELERENLQLRQRAGGG
jgi:hypothetical protein